MQFFSTRDQNRKVTSSQAIAQGLSDEGGLFVPDGTYYKGCLSLRDLRQEPWHRWEVCGKTRVLP